MTFLNYVYPVLFPVLFIGLLFVPCLVIIAFIPKRLHAARHAVIASTFVCILGYLVLAPIVGNYNQGRALASSQGVAVKPLSSRSLRASTNARSVSPTKSGPVITMPASFQPNWGFSTALYKVARTVGLAWLLIGYMLSLVVLVTSKRSRGANGFRVSNLTRVPITLWAGKHFIVMPKDANEWPQERLDRVIAHENAHIRRFDWFWQASANLVVASTFLNPFAWLCLRKMRNEAEFVADQQVLLQSGHATEYATDLLEITKASRRSLNCAVLAVGNKGSLRRRVQAILDNAQPKRYSRVGTAGAAMLSLLMFVGCMLLLVPLVQALPGILQVAKLQMPDSYAGMSTSYYSDIRQGLTTPGRNTNVWTGRFANGVEAKLIGIYCGTNSGANYSDMEGKSMAPPAPASHFIVGHPGKLDLLFAIPSSKVDPSMNIAIGSASSSDHTHEPSSMTFAGGYSGFSADHQTVLVHGFLELNNPRSGESLDSSGKWLGHGPLATEVSVSLCYSGKAEVAQAIPLDQLLAGQKFSVGKSIIRSANRTNAEKECLKIVGLPSDAAGVRVETPRNSMMDFEVTLADSTDGNGAIRPREGCGGQEDATPGYKSLQEWFHKADLGKRYVILKGSRYYATDFLSIPIPKINRQP